MKIAILSFLALASILALTGEAMAGDEMGPASSQPDHRIEEMGPVTWSPDLDRKEAEAGASISEQGAEEMAPAASGREHEHEEMEPSGFIPEREEKTGEFSDY